MTSTVLAPAPTTRTPSGRTASDFAADVVVVARRAEADGVVGVEFALPGGADLPAWAPGAHIDVELPGGLTRQYSLCGDPADPARWRIGVLREPDGRGGSRWIADELTEGATLRVRGPGRPRGDRRRAARGRDAAGPRAAQHLPAAARRALRVRRRRHRDPPAAADDRGRDRRGRGLGAALRRPDPGLDGLPRPAR